MNHKIHKIVNSRTGEHWYLIVWGDNKINQHGPFYNWDRVKKAYQELTGQDYSIHNLYTYYE